MVIHLDDVELQENETAGGPIRVAIPFDSATGTASTAAVLFELDSGSELATHTDSAEEVLLVLEGEAEATIGDRGERLPAGSLAIVPSMVPHSVRNVGARPLRVLGIFSSSAVVATFEEPMGSDGRRSMVIGAPYPLAVAVPE
jgi:quercetin dioxygenase-like cupin family protein